MRGKAETNVEKVDETRITPAHAGKSEFVKMYESLPPGSPPHMRGKATLTID